MKDLSSHWYKFNGRRSAQREDWKLNNHTTRMSMILLRVVISPGNESGYDLYDRIRNENQTINTPKLFKRVIE